MTHGFQRPRVGTRRRLAIVASAITAALILSGAASATPPRQPLVMGISLKAGSTARTSDDLPALDAFIAATGGRPPASYSIWSDWGGANAAFPRRALLDGIVRRGATPVIFWQPTNPNVRLAPARYAYARIIAGDWDAYLVRWAKAARAWDHRIIVRWAHEMNGDWFPWAMGKVGNTPAGYVAAWRHIVGIVRSIAPKVRFMWCPNSPNAGMPSLASLYPGDAWVDMVAFDAYNWKGTTQTSMLRIYRDGLQGLASVTSRKAMYVGETGIRGPGRGRGAWLVAGYRALYAAYPRLRGILYFQIDMTVGHQPDWRLLAADGSLGAYRKLMAEPRFGGRL